MLSAKQRRFVEMYTGNATEAALQAGYSTTGVANDAQNGVLSLVFTFCQARMEVGLSCVLANLGGVRYRPLRRS